MLTFWSYRKNGLIRKKRLISEFMTSQSGQQTITIHMLSNISRSKSNQATKFGKFFESHAENEAAKLVPDVFFFFNKALFEIKSSGLQPSFNIFR